MLESVFIKIAVILAVATVIGAIAQLLRQPLIVAFIAVGILMGPSVTGLAAHSGEVELFARLGIALLLFVVGLKLDLHIIRTVGPVALASGLGQVIFTSVVGYGLALMLGLAPVEALYVAVALTFSSTIIIVKLLSDKREVDTLHGRIAVGFLIVQDIVVVLVMIALTAFGQAGDDVNIGIEAAWILFKGIAMLLSVALLMRYILPALLARIAHSAELLMLFAIAWAVVGATAGDLLGFSKEVGAFLAGISIASTPYRELVAARLVSLRDFLLLFFFVELGAGLDLASLGGQIVPALVFSVFVLIGNPIIVMIIMGYMGYRKRTGFLSGLAVAQISEFSLILAALGLTLGHVSQDTVGLITLVGLITISLSTYMILYSQPLYERLAPMLDIFERKQGLVETDGGDSGERLDAVVFGLGRFGSAIASRLRDRGLNLLAVDLDPESVRRHAEDGYQARFGDAEDPEFLASLPLDRADWVVATLRDRALTRALIKSLRHSKFGGRIAVAGTSEKDRKYFLEMGVDLVLVPYTDAADDAAQRLFPDAAPLAAEDKRTSPAASL